MKPTILFLVLTFLSCSSGSISKNINAEDSSIELLYINDNIKVNWHVDSSQIVNDSLWQDFLTKKDAYRDILIEKLTDSTSYGIDVCFKESKLKVGDIAFYMLDRTYDVPYFMVFGIQLCTFECGYSVGLYDFIDENRIAVQQIIKDYLVNDIVPEPGTQSYFQNRY